MGVLFRPLDRASVDYFQEEEDQFRRDLENYLLAIVSSVNEASSASHGAASAASKRESLLFVNAGPADTSGTSVTATGSTTARTLQDRFAEVYNVKDFGAVGDGVTDDVDAINAAIVAANAGGGGIVRLPAGTYSVANSGGLAQSIISKSNVWIRGDGVGATEIVLANASNSHVISSDEDTTDITISDLTIDGNGDNQVSTGTHGILFRGGSDDARVVNVHIKDAHHYGIGFEGTTSSFSRSMIDRVYIENAGGDGIDFKDPESTTMGIHISNVIVDGWGAISTTSQAGIDIRGIAELSNIMCINQSGGTSGPVGVRFRIAGAGAPGVNEAAHYSSLTNFHIQGTVATLRGVNLGGGTTVRYRTGPFM